MIIGVCGRVSAGKETLTKFLREKGFIYFETSQLINEELVKKGLEITRKNQQDLADSLRKKEGVGVLMKMLLAKTEKGKSYIFDSLRNAGEAVFLRENAEDFILIGVDASQKTRFERIVSRNKPSDPKTWEEFLKMDERDNFDTSDAMGQQTGKLLEMSDFVVVNDSSIEEGLKKVEEVWEKIKCL
jgi:dephospho-CoA kinase